MLLKERLEERGRRWCVRQSFYLHSVVQIMTDQNEQIRFCFLGMQALSRADFVGYDNLKFPLSPTFQSSDELPCSGTVEYKQQDSNNHTHWYQIFSQHD